MAWLKINENKLVNLDKVFDISYGTYFPTLKTQCYTIILRQEADGSKYVVATFKTKERRDKAFALIQIKLFSNEIIDISNETLD